MFEVIMPKLGLTMETGLIEKWLKKEGDPVEEGDILFEVMTDKVSLEVESYNKGILRKILRAEGEEVPVTEVVAYIGEADEEIPDKKEASLSDKASTAQEKTDTAKEEKVETAEPAPQAGQAKTSKKKIFITPLARKKAKELGIDYVQ
jgi:pyruvate dehydrogenase E2 component (dihydrolipoamide acetyltransferase)